MKKILIPLLSLTVCLGAQEQKTVKAQKPQELKEIAEQAVEKSQKTAPKKTPSEEAEDINDPFENNIAAKTIAEQKEDLQSLDKRPTVFVLAYAINADGKSQAILELNHQKDSRDWLRIYEGQSLSLAPLPYSILVESISKTGVIHKIIPREIER